MSAYSDMQSHPYIWENLGFDQLPTYELLREFINERLSPVLDDLIDALVVELGKELKSWHYPIQKGIRRRSRYQSQGYR